MIKLQLETKKRGYTRSKKGEDKKTENRRGKGLIMDVDMGYIKNEEVHTTGKYEAYQPVLPKSRSMRADR